jgi:ComF family protein
MSFLEAAIGWVAPPQCLNCGLEGIALCKPCSSVEIINFGERCWRCNVLSPGCRSCAKCRRLGSPSHVWISTNYEGLARRLLSLYKFGHHRAAVEPIANLMAATLLKYSGDDNKNYLVVPIPTATNRVRERGFDHVDLLSREIAQLLRLDEVNVMRRLGQTRQLGSKREARLNQLQGSFFVKNNKKIIGRNVLLIDDVLTTGGTLKAAAQTMRSAGAKQVDALLFAKRL